MFSVTLELLSAENEQTLTLLAFTESVPLLGVVPPAMVMLPDPTSDWPLTVFSGWWSVRNCWSLIYATTDLDVGTALSEVLIPFTPPLYLSTSM